mgnify:CR=1 FL=1
MALARELAGVSEKLNTAKQEAKSIFTGIVQSQSQISQLASLEERYGQLKSQYESDMNRLDGSKRLGDNAERCPFCDGEIPAEECVSYEEACKAEKVKVAAQLQDLESVLSETHSDYEAELSRLAELEERRDGLTAQIEDVLKPDYDNLGEILEAYKAASSMLSYMLDQCGNCQVIIVENEIPDNVDFSAASLIEFTKNGSIGRYGFLLDQLIL